MLVYKNNSLSIKTFYGVTFHPGDIKSVPGYINSAKFIRVKSVPKELPERTEPKRRGRPKKNQTSKKSTKQAESNSKPEEDKDLQEKVTSEGGNS